MSWIQGFNQAYPGAFSYLQAGGFLPTVPIVPTVPGARMPNHNWQRAQNFAFGAIGPAIGLSPMVYGIPFPGYPSLAQQQKVGVSPAESEQWREVYAAQMRDRGVVQNPLPDWCPSSITTKIRGSSWCWDPKTKGWICAEPSGHCNGEGERPGLSRLTAPGRRRATRLLRRARARRQNPHEGPQQVSPWAATPGYGTGQYGGQWGPNRELNAASRVENPVWPWVASAGAAAFAGSAWWRTSRATKRCRLDPSLFAGGWLTAEGTLDPDLRDRLRNLFDDQMGGVYGPAPETADALADRAIQLASAGLDQEKADLCQPQQAYWGRMKKVRTAVRRLGAEYLAQFRGANRGPDAARVANPCVYCGRTFCCGPDMTVGKCCKLKRGPARQGGRLSRSRFRTNSTPTRRPLNPDLAVLAGSWPQAAAAMSGGARPTRLQRRARARRQNPGPHAQPLAVPPFCDASTCTTHHCGDCDPSAYAVPGAVNTVDEAVEQADADVDFAVHAAAQATRAMYAPGARAWATPSLAILSKLAGPAPVNPMTTAQWPTCAAGPAMVADPSSNRQPLQR